VCGDGNQIPPPKTPQTGEVEGPASAGTSVILLIIGTSVKFTSELL